MSIKPHRRTRVSFSKSGEYKKMNSNNVPVRSIGYARAIDWTMPKPSKTEFGAIDFEKINIAYIKQKSKKAMPNIRNYFTCPEHCFSFSTKGWMKFIFELHPEYCILDGTRKGMVIGQINIVAEKGHAVNDAAGLDPSHKLRTVNKKGEDGTVRPVDIHIIPICSIFSCRTNRYAQATVKREWFPDAFVTPRGRYYTFYLQFYARHVQDNLSDVQ